MIDPEGVTFFATRRIQLAPFICQILEQALARSVQQPLYTADAVTVLAHESAHASGIKAENLALTRSPRDPCGPQFAPLSSQTSRSPSNVRNGSTWPMVRECGAIRSTSPPVPITGASVPSSPRIASTIPSTWPAKP
jgi:hypothetical protein